MIRSNEKFKMKIKISAGNLLSCVLSSIPSTCPDSEGVNNQVDSERQNYLHITIFRTFKIDQQC